MADSQFGVKLKKIFVGRQSLQKRFPTAFFSALALSFILFFFGPLDLSHIAEAYVNYNVMDILTECLIVFGIVFAVFFLVSWLPGGKLHVWLCSALNGLAVAFYIQGNYLNPDLGALDGTAIEWHNYSTQALIGLGIFILIMLIPFFIHYFSRKAWKTYVIFTSLLLVLMQAVPLTIMLLKESGKTEAAADEHYVMAKGDEYTLGQENIVVFILDAVSPKHIADALKNDPNLLEPFHDFTSFDNYHTFSYGTFPSTTTLLTHSLYDSSIPDYEWFKRSWASDDSVAFYHQMAENGWTTRIFNNIKLAAGNYENEYGLVSNVQKVSGASYAGISKATFARLISLSFYRYFPLAMKACFWIYTDDLNSMKEMSEDEEAWSAYQSFDKFNEKGLTLRKDDKVYVMYHYRGIHSPYTFTADAKYQEAGTSLEEQLLGHIYVLKKYLQQMKDLKIYDSSTIIITSDHGTANYPHGILYIKPAGQHQDAITVSHAPITQMNYMASIAEFAGLDSEQFGQTFYEVPEDEKIERCTDVRFMDPDLPEIKGKSSNALKRYCYIGGFDELRQKIVNNDYEVIPLEYPHY